MLVPQRLHRLRDPVLEPELLVEPRGRREPRRARRASPSSQAATLVVGELRVIAHARAVDVAVIPTAPSAATDHLDDDRQPVLVLVRAT